MDDESASIKINRDGRPACTGEDDSACPTPAHRPASHQPVQSSHQHQPRHGSTNHAGAATPFGADLAQVLTKQCDGRLSAINWFRTDWQRGGALTGYARFTSDAGWAHPVVVKLPIPPCERLWLLRLQQANTARTSADDEVVPRVYAHGQTLGGYDLAWVVMERMPHGPLGQAWGGARFDLLIETMGRFYQRASDFPLDGVGMNRDWEDLLRRSRDHVRHGAIGDAQCWKQALKMASRKIDNWLSRWHDRLCQDLVHGDFHPANAMTRMEPPGGPALLFDLAAVRPGHWIEDAVYLEHLYWATPQSLHNRRVCSLLAKARKDHCLPVDADWPQLAQIKRALLAMSAPVMAHHDSGPPHLQAALHVLRASVGTGF